jgi:dihydrofolate reductase
MMRPPERRFEMGKVIATTQATVDGVIDSVGEWVQPEGDHGEHSFKEQEKSAGLLLGRKTYEGLAGFWPDQPEDDKWAAMVNPLPKYVGSKTLSGDLEWNATLLDGDIETAVPKLKDDLGGDLFVHGSGDFAHALAEAGLVDEYQVYVNPLVYGGGLHVLGDKGKVELELDDVTKFDSGVVLLTYRPA